MIEALHFEFMRNALMAGLLASVICGVIGSLILAAGQGSLSWSTFSESLMGAVRTSAMYLKTGRSRPACAIASTRLLSSSWVKKIRPDDAAINRCFDCGMVAGRMRRPRLLRASGFGPVATDAGARGHSIPAG